MTQTTATGLSAAYLEQKFQAALPYAEYVAQGNEQQRESWQRVLDQTTLTSGQRELVGGFVRDMHVLVSSGVWCGDCVQQCPLLQRISEATPHVRLRFVDRDEHADLAEQVRICGGLRVPVAIFKAEDFEPVSIFGDRTLTRYRAMAQRARGAHCPVPGAPVDPEELAGTLQDWLDEFERVHLLLRLSTRLRQKHGD